jgi:transcription factor C subunit 6
MTRQLRPRKAKPSYVLVADLDETLFASVEETSRMNVDDDGSSGSEFSPENTKGVPDQMQQDGEDDEEQLTLEDKVEFGDNEPPMNLMTDMDMEVIPPPSTATAKAKGKGKAPAKKGNGHPSLEPGLTRTRRQMYTLPTPSIHHRHRAVPLFRRDGRAERLKQKPELFKAPSVVMTNGISDDKVMERVSKAWGYNVGPGPLWEMAEDRGWFKEAELLGKGGDTEAERRPVVHRAVQVKNGWETLTKEYVCSSRLLVGVGDTLYSGKLHDICRRIQAQQKRET